jgi:hypothetical protein
MALFLTRQATTHGLTLGDGATQGFTDIATFDAATQKAINQLKQLGITSGTSATTFDPNGLVPRWQMALFVTRLASKAGVTLGSGASQGFTDIGALDAATQTAINQAKQAGIADGTSATTFDPLSNTLRWQMALFLTRVLAADGIAPTGIGLFVTRFNGADNTADRYQVADPATCTTSLVSYAATGSTFGVNGVAASKAAFEAALAALAFPANVIQATSSGTSHSVTTGVLVGSGTIDTPNFTTTFNIIEPVTASILRSVAYNQAFDSYTVGGVGAALGGFNGAVSQGDTAVLTGGDGTTSAKARTIALTNNTVTGNVTTTAGATVNVATSCPGYALLTTAPGADTHTYTVDGASALQAAFFTAATSNDLVTYSRNAGASTWTLTNQAPSAITGKVSAFDKGAADTVTIAVSSTSVTTTSYGAAGATLRVDGFVQVLLDFETALTLGDGIVFQADNPATTAIETALSITSALFAGVPVSRTATTVTTTINGQPVIAVDYTANQPATIGGTATTAPTYTLNGASATLAQFQAGIDLAIASLGGSVSTTQVGTALVWNVQTS